MEPNPSADGTPPEGSTETLIFALERPLPALLTHYLIRCAPFLREVTTELRAIREALERRPPT